MSGSQSSRANQWFDAHFRWRGRDVSRLEGLTDAVFAIVLALLFLRSVPPGNFDELSAAMKALVPFAAMFAIVAYVWFELWCCARRYALSDGWTLVLNLLLLFLLLFYAYPLKFLFTLIAVGLLGPIGEQTRNSMSVGGSNEALGQMFVVYGLGYGAIFGAIGAMHRRAVALADRLELNEAELLLAKSGASACFLQAGIAGLSAGIAFAGYVDYGAPGWVFAAIGPLMAWHGVRTGRRIKRLRLQADSLQADSP
ncbi:MAG: TMEM175 family protein [Planctomycetota bacterium]